MRRLQRGLGAGLVRPAGHSGAWHPDEAAFFRAIGGTASGAVIRTALARRKATGYPPVGHPERADLHRIAAYYAVPVTRTGICSAVLALGPVVLGVTWARSWFHPGPDGTLPAFDHVAGGHAICAVGWGVAGLWLQNSWAARGAAPAGAACRGRSSGTSRKRGRPSTSWHGRGPS